MQKSLKILFVTTDMAPFSKAGGLGDVSRSLPKAISKMGHDIRIMMPRHGVIDEKLNKIELATDNLKVRMKDKVEIDFRIKKGMLDSKLPVYFIDKYRFFGGRSKLYGYEDENQRYMFFSFAVLKALENIEGWTPDVIHCNDWQTGLIPYLLKAGFNKKEKLKKIKTIFTIHNLTFQMGLDWWKIDKKEQDDGVSEIPDFKDKHKIDRVNFMKRAILSSDIVNTVSEQYAKEITQEKFGQGLHDILAIKEAKKEFFGIMNGIDYKEYNPKTDGRIAENYDENDFEIKKPINKKRLQKEFGLEENENIPVVAMASRITEQKGFDLILEIINVLLRLKLQLAIVGSADPKYRKAFKKLARNNPKKVAAHLEFDKESITKVYAGSDMFLMPSRFEPCGLGQMISLRYGSIPVVRETGGLSDTITNYDPETGIGNGFVFKTYNPKALLVAMVRALENFKFRRSWHELVKKGMKESFSWEVPAQKYVMLYNKAIKRKENKFMYKAITGIGEKLHDLAKKENFEMKKPLKDFILKKKRFYASSAHQNGKKIFLKARIIDDNGSVAGLKKEMGITKLMTENKSIAGKVNFTKFLGGSVSEIPEWYAHEFVEGKILGDFYDIPKKILSENYVEGVVENLRNLQTATKDFIKDAEKIGIIGSIKKRGYDDYKNTIAFYEKEKVGKNKINFAKISELFENNKKLLDEDPVIAHGDFTLANQIVGDDGKIYLSDWESVRIDNIAADLAHLWVQSWRYPQWREKLLGTFLENLPDDKKENFKTIFRLMAIEQSLAEIRWNSELCEKKYKKGIIDMSIKVIQTALEGFEGFVRI